jgi:putative endonuclease
MNEHRYYVYIMASRTHVFYVGVTNNIVRRVRQHKERAHEGFTARYNVDRLVWYEVWPYVRTAIAREKQIKPWRREKKIRLIESLNPTWQDLSEEWGKAIQPLRRTADPSTPLRSGRDDNS